MSKPLLRLALLTYPRDYRRAYSDEITEVALRGQGRVPLRELLALVLGGARQHLRMALAGPSRSVTVILPRPLLVGLKAAAVLLLGLGSGALLPYLLYRRKLGTLCEQIPGATTTATGARISRCADLYYVDATVLQRLACLVVGMAAVVLMLPFTASLRRKIGK